MIIQAYFPFSILYFPFCIFIKIVCNFTIYFITTETNGRSQEDINCFVVCPHFLHELKGLKKLTQLKTLDLRDNKLTDVKGLEKLTQITTLSLYNNQLTDVKNLEKLSQLIYLYLGDNPDLTKAQIAELQKALPKCRIYSTATK